MSWTQHLSIVEEPGVSEKRDAYAAQWPRFEDAWDALVWLLCRRASVMGTADQRDAITYRLYAQAGDSFAKTPRIVVLFQVTGSEVIIEAITASAPPEEEGTE